MYNLYVVSRQLKPKHPTPKGQTAASATTLTRCTRLRVFRAKDLKEQQDEADGECRPNNNLRTTETSSNQELK